MDMRAVLGLILLALIASGCAGNAPIVVPEPNFTNITNNTINPPPTTNPQCGGIAGFQCPAGYDCILDGTYPDAGGVCVPQVCGGEQKITCPDGYECQALTRCGGSRCGPDSEGKCVQKGISPELPPASYCETAADCITGGCSGQICQTKVEAANGGGITTCEWREEYSCYKAEGCGCVANKCAWSAETISCVESKLSGSGVADLSGPLNVRTGSHFSVKLYSNPSTGYTWNIDVSNSSVVEYLGYDADNCAGTTPGIVGAGCDMDYKFVANELGSAKITMRYARSWETGVAPVNITSLDVQVVGYT
ncbi:MAG: protease inhibitor I42 family protein [Candidatus Micrarchaeia archaeon]|jgi:eight-cysteine-cluster-containing protein